jgi:hypothetical protein
MAVAAPARRTAPAPAPSRTAPPRKKAAPGRRAPAKPAPRGRAVAAPATAPAPRAPARRAPARAPQRGRPKTRRSGGQLIPIAVGRTAGAVRQLPDSGLVVRMTRGRAWIGVLGVLLVGIVALNVVTLSFAASSGKIAETITGLEQDSSVVAGRDAKLSGTEHVRNLAAQQGLAMSTSQDPKVIKFGPDTVATAVKRLAGAG